MRDELTRLSYWFPIIEAAGLPVPKTMIIHLAGEDDLVQACDGERPLALLPLACDIFAAAVELGGAPFFLRTDYTSGKHDWEHTCFVPTNDISVIEDHVITITEYSHLVDLLGLPTNTWAVREMLKTEAKFAAFDGRMPITREFRFFVRDGVIEHVQPYWPAGAFENHFVSDPTWRRMLSIMSRMTDDERAELERLTLAVSAALPGFWSVDWLLTTDRGWVLTDMAEGGKSYRYDP